MSILAKASTSFYMKFNIEYVAYIWPSEKSHYWSNESGHPCHQVFFQQRYNYLFAFGEKSLYHDFLAIIEKFRND